MLTGGDDQQKRFEKSLDKALKTLLERFVGDKAPPKWADDVFTDGYDRHFPLQEVWDHIENYGKLPWIRSEKAVQQSGIHLEEDLVSILEAVENLYLYFRDYIEDPSPQDPSHFVGTTEQQIRGRKIETLERLMKYSGPLWHPFHPQIQAPRTTGDDPALAEIQEILGPSCSDQDLTNIGNILAKERARSDLPACKLREEAVEAAKEAVRRVQAKETSSDACGTCACLSIVRFQCCRIRPVAHDTRRSKTLGVLATYLNPKP